MPNKKYGYVFNALLQIAQDRDITVHATNLKTRSVSVIRGLWVCSDEIETITIDTYNIKGKNLLHVLAHEIGHSVLHKDIIKCAAHLSNKSYCGKIEDEADAYAVELLCKIESGRVAA